MAPLLLVASLLNDKARTAQVAKPVRTTKPGRIRTTHAQGIGYYIPDSMPNSKWHKIKQKWDQKLNDSGFTDLEMYSHALDGHFLPMFTENSIEKNQKVQAGAIGPAIEGYFSYCSTYYEHCNWRGTFNLKRYGHRWALMREVFRLHKDGVSYSDMRQALQGRQTRYMKRFNIAATSWQSRLRQRRSKYWCFDKVRLILEQMWLWHATDANGALTPYDLKHMSVTGITPEVIAAASDILIQRLQATEAA